MKAPRALHELDDLRGRLLDEVRASPQHIRTAQAGTGDGWTAVQVLQHLLLVESLVLSGLDRDAGNDRRRRRRTVRDRVGGIAVSLVFLLRIRVRMPTRRVDPVPPLSFEEVEARWTTVGAELGLRLREAAALAPERAVMRHPVSGPLSPPDTAAFLLKHMRHHERQLHRILAAGPPRPSTEAAQGR
ncbi:MAG: DinB family protein [Gemmatimonadales bacterium]|nr:MAG: DinB family protein [Gemmatimonadales bacterium]